MFIGIERGADTFFICFTGCMWILLEGERDGFPADFPHANVFWLLEPCQLLQKQSTWKGFQPEIATYEHNAGRLRGRSYLGFEISDTGSAQRFE